MSNVTHPKHYNSGKIEVIEAIEDWKLSYHLGNAVKYVARAGKKDPKKYGEDLEKAVWYLKRELERHYAILQDREITRPSAMNPQKEGQDAVQVKGPTSSLPEHDEREKNHVEAIQRLGKGDPTFEQIGRPSPHQAAFERR